MPKFANMAEVGRLKLEAKKAGVPHETIEGIVNEHKHHGILMDRDVPDLKKALEKAINKKGEQSMPKEQEDLKLKGIKASNIMGFDNIEVTFKNGHTRIYAPNGGGKTSLKKLIQQCFFGVSQTNRGGSLIGEKFRFIGSKGAASDTEVILQDVKGDFTVTVTNHMTKSSNGIKIEASDGRELTKEWLLDFFNEAFFSAENFLSYTPQQQTELLGIKTGEFDANIKTLKVKATEIRAEIKVIGEPKELEKVERVDVLGLVAKRDEIADHNAEQCVKSEKLEWYDEEIANQEGTVASMKAALEKAEKDIKELKRVRSNDLPRPEPLQSADDINERIDTADETNQQATAYEANEVLRLKKDAAIKKLGDNQAEIGKENDKRTTYIKSFKLPMKGMTVDDKGGLLIKDRYLDSFSQSEQIIIVAKLNASQNPSNKTVWIDKYESLDQANQKKIVKDLIEKGYDVITAEVGDQKEGDGSILLRDCAVVGAEKEEDSREDVL